MNSKQSFIGPFLGQSPTSTHFSNPSAISAFFAVELQQILNDKERRELNKRMVS
jgi:hypothetical protein